jgi:mono/diheme cytochrome c family protein
MRSWQVPLVVVGAALAAVAAWLAFTAWQKAERRTVGRQVYAERCAACHGKDLEGQPNWKTRLPNGRLPGPPHDATGHTWHHSDAELFLITKKGMVAIVPDYESDMQGFEDVLTDAQIQMVLDFIKSTWPEREREYQRNRTVVKDR